MTDRAKKVLILIAISTVAGAKLGLLVARIYLYWRNQ
jgi:hypothetical protein